jgi:phenylacetate-CoA ligase
MDVEPTDPGDAELEHVMAMRSLVGRAVTTARIAVTLPGQWKAAYRSPQQIAAARDRRVRATVRYAAATVPFYRRLFPELGIDPREIVTATDLERIPIIDRSIVQSCPEDFLSTSRLAREAVRFNTSGSTGEPLSVWHDRATMAANVAYSLRARQVVAQFCGRTFRYRELSVRRRDSTLQRIGDHARRDAILPRSGRRLVLQPSDPVEVIVSAINAFRPDVLRGYGSFLESFVRTVAAQDIPLHRPKLVIFGADGLSHEGRRLIRETLGAPVVGSYGSVEIFKIAFQCGEGPHYHLHEDLAFVRVVDDAGRTLPAGQRGQLVVSDLVNRATVLLNYRLGDVSMRLDGRCSCGRTLPLLGDVEGRAEDILTLADGSTVHPRDLWALVGQTPGLLRYQLVQRRLDDFELRLVMADDEAWTAVAETLPSALSPILHGARVMVTRHESLEPGPSGKFRLVVGLGQDRRSTTRPS